MSRRFLPPAVAALAFVAYARLAARDVTGEDAGHLATAAFELGIPHPPGYPLWCLLARLAMEVPVGEPCFRASLFSGACAAAAAWLVAATVLRLGGGGAAAAAAALLLVASRTVASQSVVCEVYALNLALIASLLLFYLRWKESPSTGRLAALGFAGALAASHHPTSLLASVPIVAAVLLSRPFPLRSPRALAAALGGVVAGLLPILYLPIRSAADPYLDWGDPESLRNLWTVLRRRQYGGASLDLGSLADVGATVGRLGAYASAGAREWAIPGLPVVGTVLVLGLAGMGTVVHRRRDRAGARVLAGLFALGGPGVVLLLGLDVAASDVENLPVYGHAGIPALVLLAGVGIGALPPVARRLALAIPLLAAVSSLREVDRSRYPWVADWARNVLAGAEERAAIFAYPDDQLFPLYYAQRVEGLRPDVLLLGNVANGVHRELLAQMDARSAARASRASGSAQRRIQELFLLPRLAPRPVCFTEPREFDEVPGVRVVPRGLLWRFVRPGETEPPPSSWDRYRWRFSPEDPTPDAAAAHVLGLLALSRGCDALARGKREEAVAEFGRLPEGARGVGTLWLNAGSALARAEAFSESVPFFERASRAGSREREARANLGLAFLASGRAREAIPPLREALEAEPGDVETGLALLAAERLAGEDASALATAQALAARAPQDPRPLLAAADILLRSRNDVAGARALLDRAAALGPLSPEAQRLRDSLAPR